MDDDLEPAPQGYPIKLVRDGTPMMVNQSGVPGQLWYENFPGGDLGRIEHNRWLKLKLAEEVGEFLVDGGEDELKDVLAVVDGLAHNYGSSLDKYTNELAQHPRGGFRKGVMMLGRHDESDRKVVR